METIWNQYLHHAVAIIILDEINCKARVIYTFFYERNITMPDNARIKEAQRLTSDPSIMYEVNGNF